MPFQRKRYSDKELLAKLKDGTLPPADFTHEAHIRLVWILRRQNFKKLTYHAVSEVIKNYANAIGEGHIFHETLTYAAVMIVLERIENTPASDFFEFIENNLDLILEFKSLVHKHYSVQLIELAQAKEQIVAPDLIPF